MTEQGIFEEQAYLFRKAVEILSLYCSKSLNTSRFFFSSHRLYTFMHNAGSKIFSLSFLSAISILMLV